MKLKISQVLALDQVISSLGKEKLPLGVAYKLAQLRSALTMNVEFATAKTNEYIQTYVQRDENNQPKLTSDGKGLLIQTDKVQECNDKMRELDNMEVDIPDTEISFSELMPLTLTIDEMTAILPIIKK